MYLISLCNSALVYIDIYLVLNFKKADYFLRKRELFFRFWQCISRFL